MCCFSTLKAAQTPIQRSFKDNNFPAKRRNNTVKYCIIAYDVLFARKVIHLFTSLNIVLVIISYYLHIFKYKHKVILRFNCGSFINKHYRGFSFNGTFGKYFILHTEIYPLLYSLCKQIRIGFIKRA